MSKIKILVLNGPSLNMLGITSDTEIYGKKTLEQINKELQNYAKNNDIELTCIQSNCEGDLISVIQNTKAHFIIINPGSLSMYGHSLVDALEDSKIPFFEVHMTNIYKRNRKSIISPIADGIFAGLGQDVYGIALYVAHIKLME